MSMSKLMPIIEPNQSSLLLAQTFTFRYDGREDRMMMTLNYASHTGRLDLMLTRAMILKLIPVVERLMLDHGVSHSLQPSAVKTNTKNVSATDTDLLDVMAQEALLLEKIDFKMRKNKERIALIFYTAAQPVAHAVMTPEHFAQIMQLLIQSIPHHSWGISANILML